MKKITQILAKCFLSFLFITSLNAQNTTLKFGSDIGNVGIGTTSPTEYLQIAGGNIDINTPSNAYMLGGYEVLWNNGNSTSIYVGVKAGNSGSTQPDNTYVGYLSGNLTTMGYANTCVGANAGKAITSAVKNVFIGFNAGAMTASSGDNNTFVGFNAGNNNTDGVNNSFFGDDAGLTNKTGMFNVAIGDDADFSNNNLTNAISIGCQAVVNHDDQLILGGDFYSVIPNPGTHHSTFVGIGLSGTLNFGLGPQNSLEINADPAKSSTTATGLRFTQVRNLNANNTYTLPQQTYDQTTIQPWGKVLTVDENGDVGLTDDLGGGSLATADNGLTNSTTNIQLGGITGSGTGKLLHDSEIPMNDFNLIFSDPASINGNTNSVGIGILTTTAKFHVSRSLSTISVNVPTAVRVENKDIDIPGPMLGTSVGISNSTNGLNRMNIGINSSVFNALINYGGNFTTLDNAAITNIGSYFLSGNSPNNFSVYGNAPLPIAAPGTFNVAIYGTAPVNAAATLPPVVGTGSWAGYFNGDLLHTGWFGIPSDSSIKTNIKKFKNASSIINALSCYTYNYDSTKYGDHLNFPKSTTFGFLANEVAAVAPEIVINGLLPPKFDTLGNVLIKAQPVLMIDYERMIPILLEGIKEQSTTIDSLNTRLNNLEAIVANCCSQPKPIASPETTGENDRVKIKLENSATFVLYQNQPNPYTNSTVIRFFIPENVSDVTITFQDNTGNTLKEVKINQSGQGSIELDGSDLSTGIYTYSLLVAGKIIDTKKMVKN